jgi:ribosomal 50S subunit-recycling heat shock protein
MKKIMELRKILIEAGIANTRGLAFKYCQSGSIKLNGKRVMNPMEILYSTESPIDIQF